MSELWQRNLPVPFFSQRGNKYIWQRLKVQDDLAGMTEEEEAAYHQEKANAAFSLIDMIPKYSMPHHEDK